MARLYLGSSKISPMFMFKNVKSLGVTPTTSAQTISAPEGGVYSQVNVGAVTSSIDSNIQAGNIKKGIKILGVTGNADGSSENNTDVIREIDNGVLKIPSFNFTFTLPSNATDIANYALYYAFQGCSGLISVNLSSLTTISGTYALSSAFYDCSSLTSADLSSLVTISGTYALQDAFRGCSSLTSVDLSSLVTISAGSAFSNTFRQCTSLTSMSFPSLSTISGSNAFSNIFNGCTSLASLNFPALTSTSFGSYTNQFNNMLFGVTGCAVHFPSNLQSVIGSWSDVTAGFGGTNTVVSFDLPATT